MRGNRLTTRRLPACVRWAGRLLLLQEGSRRPFLFATVKGFTGHQESGAGVAGLMEASLLVQHAAAPPALHLRHLNPHLHGALTGHTGRQQLGRRFSMQQGVGP